MKGFRALTVATAVATYALVVLGGVVRVSGSGLGCPDWPLCHGRVLPPRAFHAIIDSSHGPAAWRTGAPAVLPAAGAWMAWRNRRDLVIPATLAVSLLAVQVVLGAITVRLELPPMIVLAHLATAMALLGAVCVTAVASLMPTPAEPADAQSARRARGAAAGTYLLILSGSLVVGSGASGACDAWPLCGGGFRFAFEGSPAIQLLHRGVAVVIGLLVIMSLLWVLARHRREPAVRATVALTLAALAFQVAVGAAVVTLHLPAVLRGLHLALASAVWTGTVVLAVIASRLPPLEQPLGIGDASRSAGRPVRDVVLDYISLAKPRIIPLLLITALGGMMMAERGWPSTGLVLLTLLGGALAAARAGALNCWVARDPDRRRLRTPRPPPSHRRIAAHPAPLR